MGEKTKKIVRSSKKASYRSKGTGRSSMKTSGFQGKFIRREKISTGWTEAERAKHHTIQREQFLGVQNELRDALVQMRARR